MTRRVRALVSLLAIAGLLPACAEQEDRTADPHAGHEMPGLPAAEPQAGRDGETATPADPHAGHDMSAAEPAAGAMPEGHAEVEVTPDRQQLIGLKVDRAERGRLSGTIRASALVQADETRQVDVHSRLTGWVRRLHVNAVGQTVRQGDPLYALYSQELHAAQEEYLHARSTSPGLASAGKTRLRLWNVPPDQISRMEREGPLDAVTFRAPIGGTVLEKNVVQGTYIEPGMTLYRIADLSRVWILAEIYEYEVDRLDRTGTARVRVQGQTEPFEATIDYVYPTVDEATRTVKVRLVAPNPEGRLRPGNFATVELPTRPIEALWVPEAALIDTGERQLVYVALPGGRFRPVVVRAGRTLAGRVEILEGIDDGTEVVVSAQFLLDSESRIRGSGQAPGHGGH